MPLEFILERKGQLVSIMLVHGHPSHANARIHRKGDNGDVKKKGNASLLDICLAYQMYMTITIGGSFSKRACGSSHGVEKR